MDQRVLAHLVDEMFPHISSALSRAGVSLGVVTVEWLMCALCTSLPTGTALRLWDAIFTVGSEALLRVALALFHGNASRILSVAASSTTSSVTVKLVMPPPQPNDSEGAGNSSASSISRRESTRFGFGGSGAATAGGGGSGGGGSDSSPSAAAVVGAAPPSPPPAQPQFIVASTAKDRDGAGAGGGGAGAGTGATTRTSSRRSLFSPRDTVAETAQRVLAALPAATSSPVAVGGAVEEADGGGGSVESGDGPPGEGRGAGAELPSPPVARGGTVRHPMSTFPAMFSMVKGMPAAAHDSDGLMAAAFPLSPKEAKAVGIPWELVSRERLARLRSAAWTQVCGEQEVQQAQRAARGLGPELGQVLPPPQPPQQQQQPEEAAARPQHQREEGDAASDATLPVVPAGDASSPAVDDLTVSAEAAVSSQSMRLPIVATTPPADRLDDVAAVVQAGEDTPGDSAQDSQLAAIGEGVPEIEEGPAGTVALELALSTALDSATLSEPGLSAGGEISAVGTRAKHAGSSASIELTI